MFYSTAISDRENNHAREAVTAKREVANLIPRITKVIEEFDNKVFNCRLEKAIQEQVHERIYVHKSRWGEHIEINVYPTTGNDSETVLYFSMDKLKDGKRIVAKDINKQLRNKRDELLREAYELETMIETLPQIKQYIQESVDKLDKYLQAIPHSVRTIYNLPYSCRLG